MKIICKKTDLAKAVQTVSKAVLLHTNTIAMKYLRR